MRTIDAIYSEKCWIDAALQPATVYMSEGRITAVTKEKDPVAYDAGTNILMPGIVDAHVHVNEPGRTEWEGFETATKAAVAGGITTFADMPLNASPVTTNISALQQKIKAANGKLFCNVALYGGLIPGNISELEALLQAGVSGIKCFLVHSGIDEFPNVQKTDLEQAMPIIAAHHKPLLAHCEIYEHEVNVGFADNPCSYQHYLASRPKKWENDAIAMMIALCRKYNCPVHIVHVASAEALPIIREAKQEGLPVTAETCAHYIYFDAESIPDGQTVYKCAPPIREAANNALLRNALADGTLDFISTDHSPAPPDVKEFQSGNFLKAWGGIAGLQFLLPASWTALRDEMKVEAFIPLLTKNPASFLGLSARGSIAPLHDADLVIWSPEENFIVEQSKIRHRHTISPYTGRQLYGKVKMTIVKGQVMFDSGSEESVAPAGNILLAEN